MRADVASLPEPTSQAGQVMRAATDLFLVLGEISITSDDRHTRALALRACVRAGAAIGISHPAFLEIGARLLDVADELDA